MNSQKIFWMMVAVLIAGFFLFMAFGVAVKPANAVFPPSAGQQIAAPYKQAAPSPSQVQGQQAPSGSGILAPLNNGVQEVQLTVQGGNYMPNPIVVKKGVPVKLVADLGTVRGCASSIVIPDFGVRKTVQAGDNEITFTPDKSGTFQFSCSMGMYQGTIVVQDADGTVADFKGTAKPAGTGSCGMSAGKGGCGCGMMN